jgi:hypothetical protein
MNFPPVRELHCVLTGVYAHPSKEIWLSNHACSRNEKAPACGAVLLLLDLLMSFLPALLGLHIPRTVGGGGIQALAVVCPTLRGLRGRTPLHPQTKLHPRQ